MGFLLYHYLVILPSWLPPPEVTGSTTADVVSTTEVVSTTTESTTVESTTASEDVDEPPQDARAKTERIKTSFFINCFFCLFSLINIIELNDVVKLPTYYIFIKRDIALNSPADFFKFSIVFGSCLV